MKEAKIPRYDDLEKEKSQSTLFSIQLINFFFFFISFILFSNNQNFLF